MISRPSGHSVERTSNRIFKRFFSRSCNTMITFRATFDLLLHCSPLINHSLPINTVRDHLYITYWTYGKFPLLYVLKMSFRRGVGGYKNMKTPLRYIKMVPN